MHEHSLIRNLLVKIGEVAEQQEDRKIVAINVQLGALAHISAAHFREHFEHETAGTALTDIQLNIEELADINHPRAQDIVLESVEFEET